MSASAGPRETFWKPLQESIGIFGTNAAKLPTGFAAKFQALLKNFTDSRTAQLGKKQEIGTGKAGTKEDRDAFTVQLTRNLLTIALDHIGNPQAGMAHFDQGIIRPGRGQADDATPTLPAGPTPKP